MEEKKPKKKKNNMLPRVCKACGATFLGGPRAWYCPSCREEREKKRAAEFRERKRCGKVVPVGAVIPCEGCGKLIVKNGGSQRYCPECAAKHLKAIDNAQSIAWKRLNPKRYKAAKKAAAKATETERDSGFRGVHWDKNTRRWAVSIRVDGKNRMIKSKDLELAKAVYARKNEIRKTRALTVNDWEELKKIAKGDGQ